MPGLAKQDVKVELEEG
jgi:HSP20 family protein